MGNELSGKSMHAIGQMIASRDATIKKLQKELAEARIGGQPASQLRDAVLPVLLKIREEGWVTGATGPTILLDRLISHLKTVPTLEPPSDKMAAPKMNHKPIVLDHGPRDNDAAAPEYRR
jgi:hypothetical protein